VSVVLLDVDGVLADFEQQLCNRLRSELGWATAKSIINKIQQRTSWDFKDILTSAENKIVWALLAEPFAGDMPLIEGAKNLVSALTAYGHEILCVSSPWISNPTWEHDRRYWLKKHFGIGHRQFISTSVKHHVDGDVLIDDKPSHVETWTATRGKQGLLFGQPYSRTIATTVPVITPHGRWDADAIDFMIRHLAKTLP
jgi:5'(3')-deoxyribonucleotidase